MAITPRVHDVAEQEVSTIPERYPGYRTALVKALDDVVGRQSMVHVGQRREEVTKVVDALGRAAVAKRGEG